MDFIFICFFVYHLLQWNLSFKGALTLSSSLYLQKYQEESLALFAVTQDMEANSMSVNGCVNKEEVVHIYNGILPSHKNQ